MSGSITVFGHTVESATEHFIPGFVQPFDVEELRKLGSLANLRSASFCDHPVDDAELGYLCEIPMLTNLSLQGSEISDAGLAQLARLPRLAYLRLKDNPQLTDRGAPHLAALTGLLDLQLHETSITRVGLVKLVTLTNLEDLVVDADEDTIGHAFLLELSARLPTCRILAKGHGEYLAGRFDD